MGVARQILKRSAAAIDMVRHPRPGVTILIYHRVGRRSRSEVDLPSRLFEEQMAYLKDTHEVIDLDEALERLAGLYPSSSSSRSSVSSSSPEGAVVVTFDDGTADFADEAMPVIDRYKVPVTLYVATDFVESQRMFPDNGKPLSWAALSDGLSTGLLTVGSHTHTHALLDRASPERIREELDTSIELIEHRLGVTPEHFAYPKAVAGSPEARIEVHSRFRSAALAGTEPNRYGHTDPYALARSPIQVSDGMQWFRRKAAGGMWAEDSLRRGINRVRHRGKTA